MICKHCGHEVPDGIVFCTACGEPMPKVNIYENQEDDPNPIQEPTLLLSKKELAKNYMPHAVKLSIHTGALMSYAMAVMNILPWAAALLLGEGDAATLVFTALFLLMAGLTLGFQIRKSFACAVILTAIAVFLSIYFLIIFQELTVIWICAGGFAVYGTYHYNKIWRLYQKTGKLPHRYN